MLMRYHLGLGVGHAHAGGQNSESGLAQESSGPSEEGMDSLVHEDEDDLSMSGEVLLYSELDSEGASSSESISSEDEDPTTESDEEVFAKYEMYGSEIL